MIVLSVLNKKGGVGKTTIATNLAQGLAILGYKVLAVDNDEQHNLTTSLGIKLRNCTAGLADVLGASVSTVDEVLGSAVYSSYMDNLDCIPGGRALDSVRSRPSALKDALRSDFIVRSKYDMVIVDNAPTLGNNTICAINSSSIFLLPVQLKEFALIGLAEMYQILTTQYHISSEQVLIVRNMYRERVTTQKNMSDAIKAAYPDSILKTIIPDDETFEKMFVESKSMFFSRTTSKATLLFQELICEIFGWPKEKIMAKFIKELKKYRSEIAKTNLEKGRISSMFTRMDEGV